MATSWLRRNDVQYPQSPNSREAYAVRYIETANATDLQNAVNFYLAVVPIALAPKGWTLHLARTHFATVGAGAGFRHCVWLTLYANGREGSGNLILP